VNPDTPDGTDLGPVRATIVVTAERDHRRSFPGCSTARGEVRALLAVVGLLAAIAAAAIAMWSTGPRRSPAARSGTAVASTDPEATVFGFRVDCPRLAIVSPDGKYARADYDMTTPCGSFGNYVTLILRRVRRSWVPQLVGTGWRCPSSALPARVLIELRLCPAPARGGAGAGVSRSEPGGR
jgi:hypothetical protein